MYNKHCVLSNCIGKIMLKCEDEHSQSSCDGISVTITLFILQKLAVLRSPIYHNEVPSTFFSHSRGYASSLA